MNFEKEWGGGGGGGAGRVWNNETKTVSQMCQKRLNTQQQPSAIMKSMWYNQNFKIRE